MNRKVWFLSLLLTMFLPFSEVGGRLLAQNDPGLASMILLYTQKAKDELKQQEEVMLLESTGHIWMQEEMNATTDLQKEFNNYLDEFHGIITYAAEVYGFYHEIDQMVTNLQRFNNVLKDHASNAVAVALSSNRNKIYREMILGSIDIVNDIRQVCLSNNKMTEKERVEIVFSIRPKLKQMNQKMLCLIRAVKYTSFADIWSEIDYNARGETDKPSIAKRCMERWKGNSLRSYEKR